MRVHDASRDDKAGQQSQMCIGKLPTSSLQILDPKPKGSQPIASDHRALDSVASDQDLSERTMRQLAGIGGEVTDKNTKSRLYISGECLGKSKFLILQTVLVRLPTAICNETA